MGWPPFQVKKLGRLNFEGRHQAEGSLGQFRPNVFLADSWDLDLSVESAFVRTVVLDACHWVCVGDGDWWRATAHVKASWHVADEPVWVSAIWFISWEWECASQTFVGIDPQGSSSSLKLLSLLSVEFLRDSNSLFDVLLHLLGNWLELRHFLLFNLLKSMLQLTDLGSPLLSNITESFVVDRDSGAHRGSTEHGESGKFHLDLLFKTN